jgi:predicted transcriptional regulator
LFLRLSRLVVRKIGSKKPKQTKAQVEAEKRQAKADKVVRAKQLFAEGWKKVRIAEELGISFDTVCRWLANVSAPTEDSEKEPFEKNLEDVTASVVTDSRLNARDEEQQTLLEVAENQASPSDKYQAYVAASAIKMLRDNLMNVRGPRTVRELSELDQLIRRNLGLNPKGGSGSSGGLSIDISILNNAKAANGGSSVVVEAEEIE